jgi:hypothetical protein
MLKQGRRFNERSLWNILRPIAEGLDRAHRVGVLHRDIKPPNILINEDNRPVLIDFGSARFDTAEATSTKVTFHTPPYAALEQYVKTYAQGPWTDVYALGVVMSECVTGEKPPEVLERLHAGLGKPLAEGKWPGYSKRFLATIDAAMVVKPDERPQSITDWLAMFGKKAGEATDEADDEATRFYAAQVATEEIVPVPPTPNVDPETVETGVPADRKQAKFKRAGEETRESKKAASEEEAVEESGKAPNRRRVPSASAEVAVAPPASGAAPKSSAATITKKKPSTAVMAGAAVAMLAVVGVGALTLRGGGSQPETVASHAAAPDESADTVAALGPSGADANAVVTGSENALGPPTAQPTSDQSAADALRSEKAKAATAEAQLAAMRRAAARTAAAQGVPGAPTPPARKADRKGAAAEQTASAEEESGGVSPAKVAQLNAAVDEARSLAKQAMRSSNRQNAQLAKNYDKYLKTLKDSMRGVQSNQEADKLIKQAGQTRAYIQFLLREQ